MGQGIAGVFDPHIVGRRQQHSDSDIDRMLGPGSDDDLLRLAPDTASCLQVPAYVPTQLDKAAWVDVAEIAGPQ